MNNIGNHDINWLPLEIPRSLVKILIPASVCRRSLHPEQFDLLLHLFYETIVACASRIDVYTGYILSIITYYNHIYIYIYMMHVCLYI